MPPDGKHPRAVGKPREGKAQAGQSTGKQLRHGIILAAVPGRPGRGMAGIQLGLRFKSHVSYQTFAAGAETAGQFQQERGFPGVRHMVESIGADDKIERPALQRGGRPRVKSYRYNSAQGILVRAASSIFWEKSTPATGWPAAYRRAVSMPVPKPKSNTSAPGRLFTRASIRDSTAS